MKTIEDIKEELLKVEEQWLIDECFDWIWEYAFDDPKKIIENFLRNYRESSVVYTVGSEPNIVAKYIHFKLGDEKLLELLETYFHIKQDYDIYHEHWNDLYMFDYTEYEIQIDIDEGTEYYETFKGSEYDRNGYISFFGYVDLGYIRVKIDAESFEAALLREYGIDVESLDKNDFNQIGQLKKMIV